MTLWNLIRDFFVQNIFGGFSSNGVQFPNSIGMAFIRSDTTYTSLINTSNVFVDIGQPVNNYNNPIVGITFGDWLSTTFTIITLILLVIFLYIFVKWIFKLFSGLLR